MFPNSSKFFFCYSINEKRRWQASLYFTQHAFMDLEPVQRTNKQSSGASRQISYTFDQNDQDCPEVLKARCRHLDFKSVALTTIRSIPFKVVCSTVHTKNTTPMKLYSQAYLYMQSGGVIQWVWVGEGEQVTYGKLKQM